MSTALPLVEFLINFAKTHNMLLYCTPVLLLGFIISELSFSKAVRNEEEWDSVVGSLGTFLSIFSLVMLVPWLINTLPKRDAIVTALLDVSMIVSICVLWWTRLDVSNWFATRKAWFRLTKLNSALLSGTSTKDDLKGWEESIEFFKENESSRLSPLREGFEAYLQIHYPDYRPEGSETKQPSGGTQW